MFEGEEVFELVLYIEVVSGTGQKLAKEDYYLNLFEARRGFSVVCVTCSLNYHLFSQDNIKPKY